MTKTKIAHDLEAEYDVVFHEHTVQLIVGYDVKRRGLSLVDAKDPFAGATVHHLPEFIIRGVWMADDSSETNIYRTLNPERAGKVREALDKWVTRNVEADDRLYYTLIDSRTGSELT